MIIEEEKKVASETQGPNKDNDEYEFMIPMTNFQRLRPFVDRYFLKYYAKGIDSKGRNTDQIVFTHTNKLVLLGLSPEHWIIQTKQKVKGINFTALHGEDLSSLVKGKRKSRDDFPFGFKINTERF